MVGDEDRGGDGEVGAGSSLETKVDLGVAWGRFKVSSGCSWHNRLDWGAAKLKR